MRGILAEKLFCRDRSYRLSTFDMQKKKKLQRDAESDNAA